MDTTNWLDETQRIMVGGKPYNNDDLQYLYNNKITVFVNLTTSHELNHRQNFKYHLKLPCNIKFIHFPIKDMAVEQDGPTMELVDKIINLSKSDIIYIHCKGGHGRTGVIAGLIIHKLYPSLSYTDVIKHIQKQHSTRKYKPKSSTPQTSQQFNQLHRIINNSQDIFFYDKKCINYVFSNFYTEKKGLPLFRDKYDREWYSSEAYYQAHKFMGISQESNEYAEIIRKTKSAHFAYILGNMGGNIRPNWKICGVSIIDIIKKFKDTAKLVDNWDEKKESIMKEAITYKFSQNIGLQKILLNSDKKCLVEYSPRDLYWGTYWHKNGKNRLGKILECVRNELQKCYVNNRF
jgi:ribA/ribD-fused uncharacterized protein